MSKFMGYYINMNQPIHKVMFAVDARGEERLKDIREEKARVEAMKKQNEKDSASQEAKE